jgi:transketolase C-terminal domain/subunit
VSSGRGVHEAITAAKILEEKDVTTSVYDMPSFDQDTMIDILKQDAITVVAEQNNGFIWHEIGQMMLRLRNGGEVSLKNCASINVNKPDGSYHFIHSATYEQLLSQFGLEPKQMADTALRLIAL